MIFTELVLDNFGAYHGRQVINLRPENNHNSCPIILFGGMNGGGKTTIMDAIRLALYGQRAQCSTRGNLGYGEFLTQAVNSQTSPIDSTRIELTFEHVVNDAWKELKIVRTWTRNPKDGKDNLGIIEGEWPDTALANTWDEYIENILPLGISNLFLFDGEQVKELAELDTPPSAVIEAIQSLLGLELAERLSIDLDILVNRKRKSLASRSQLQTIEVIEAKIKEQTKLKQELQKDCKNLQNLLEKAQEKHHEAASKFRSEGGKIAAEKSKLDLQSLHINEAIEQQRQSMRDLANSTLPLQLILPLLDRAQRQANQELKVQQAKIAINILLERDRRLLDYLNKISLSEQNIEKIQFFLAEDDRNLNDNLELEKTAYLNLSEEEIKGLESLITHQLPIQTKLAQDYLEKLKKLSIDLDTIDRQVAIAASPEEYKKLDDALVKAQKELINCQSTYDAGNRKYEEIEKAIVQTKKELAKYSEQTIDLQNDEHILKSAAKVQQTLQLFKERLTLKKLNKLEGEVTECFRYLLHKSDLVHRVAIDSENFAISLYDLQGQLVAKHRLSAGEKQLLAIAFLWGLARVSGRNLPIAIDTPLGRLDSSHRNNLVERYFPTASHQVILLSTDTEIGKNEVQLLRQQEAIAREYLLKYDSSKHQTTVKEGYFW